MSETDEAVGELVRKGHIQHGGQGDPEPIVLRDRETKCRHERVFHNVCSFCGARVEREEDGREQQN